MCTAKFGSAVLFWLHESIIISGLKQFLPDTSSKLWLSFLIWKIPIDHLENMWSRLSHRYILLINAILYLFYGNFQTIFGTEKKLVKQSSDHSGIFLTRTPKIDKNKLFPWVFIGLICVHISFWSIVLLKSLYVFI